MEDTELDYPIDLANQLMLSKNQKQQDTIVWDLCLAFLQGRQHLTFSRSTGSFLQDNAGTKNKATVNILLPIFRTMVSRLSVNYPSIAVTPTSPDTADIAKALACQEAIKWLWSTERLEYVFAHVVKWLISVGSAGLHTYWDPTKKKICVECVSPYDIFFEANCLDPEESQWVAIKHIYGRKEIQSAYPDSVEAIKNISTTINRDTVSSQQSQYPAHRIEVYDFYWRDGRHAVVLNDGTYLYKGTTPSNVMPFQFMRYTDIENKLWGLSMVYNALDSQSQLNKARNTIFENADATANPAWLIPTTCDVDPKTINNKPGNKIFYNPIGGTPVLARGGELPSYFMQNVQMIMSEINDQTGSHSTARGKQAVGISSGVAIEAITQNDVGQLQMTQSNIEKAACELTTVILTFMKHFYTEPKMIRMLDQTGRIIFKQLSQTDIIDDPQVWIEAGSLFRNESEDRDQKTMQLYNSKLISPEQAMEKLSYRFGNAEAVKKMTAFSKAQDILNSIKTGQYDVIIRSTEDISALVEVFKEFTETPEYYTLSMEIQDQIWSILVAMTDPALKDPNKQASIVWPKPPVSAPPPETVSTGLATQTPTIGVETGITMPQQPEASDALPQNVTMQAPVMKEFVMNEGTMR